MNAIFPLRWADKARFRVNVFMQRKGEAAVFRTIPTKILTLEELGMPPILKQLCEKEKGLILVTGPTGSGKSTTLAAMVDYLNYSFEGHILTIEDPIEFVHPVEEMSGQSTRAGTAYPVVRQCAARGAA